MNVVRFPKLTHINVHGNSDRLLSNLFSFLFCFVRLFLMVFVNVHDLTLTFLVQ